MMRRTQYCLVLMAVLVAGFAQAHQQKEAYTIVLFNHRTGNMEIAHRFYIHDAEHALAHLFGSKADIIGSAKTRKQFAEYIQQEFQLKDNNNNTFRLKTVGHEVEGKYFWVYQEIPIPSKLVSLQVKMNALQDIWPKQTNQINVNKDGKTFSTRIRKGDGWKSLSLE